MGKCFASETLCYRENMYNNNIQRQHTIIRRKILVEFPRKKGEKGKPLATCGICLYSKAEENRGNTVFCGMLRSRFGAGLQKAFVTGFGNLMTGRSPMSFWKKLTEYKDLGVYPMHMPGHKRQGGGDFAWYNMDITEIDGFDNLHDAQGILREAMDRAARVMGAKRSWFLVNGSTCGLLAGIFAVTKPGERVLVARNCHKAVYHALMLRGLTPVWIYPEVNSLGFAEAITPSQLQKALDDALQQGNPSDTSKKNEAEYSGAPLSACILTSPTYEGVVSPIKEIAEICHKNHILLLVDEAHGAHLPLAGNTEERPGYENFFPKSALASDADVVVQSLHKTLPSPTQTALLSLGSDRVLPERIEEFLDVFETSSPSYPLMAGIDACMEWAESRGAEAMEVYGERLRAFYRDAERLTQLQVYPKEHRDPGKILISDKNFRMTGREIYDILKDEFAIQPEMSLGCYVLLMTSPMDFMEGFRRVKEGLFAIDKRLRTAEKVRGEDAETGSRSAVNTNRKNAGKREQNEAVFPFCREFPRPECVLSMAEALESPWEVRQTAKLTGDEIAAEWITPYPPGIPVLAPGEQVMEALSWLRTHRKTIKVVCEKKPGQEISN